jgi:dGTPase
MSQIDSREALWLAPYAFRSSMSAGRVHPELPHPYRGPFQRDRDRIVHSSAFRRLSGKMQVFTGDMGDYHRTRLTHTMEVASIARTMGRALRLNEDLVEALALFHDIGHPPFGHAGEDALRDCLRGANGFSHNAFAITLAEEIEQRYPGFPGLNLSREVLAGQHVRAGKKEGIPHPILEVQVVEAADSITYNAHDVDDALVLQLVTIDELREVPLIAQILEEVQSSYSAASHVPLRQMLVRRLLDHQVGAAMDYAIHYLDTCGWTSPEDAKHADFVVGVPPELLPMKRGLEKFLFQRIYRHPQLLRVRENAQEQIRKLFHLYLQEPERLPQFFRMRGENVGFDRAAGEYIAVLTDSGCQQAYHENFPGMSAVAR